MLLLSRVDLRSVEEAYRKIGTHPLTPLAGDTRIKLLDADQTVYIGCEYRFWAEGRTDSAPLAPFLVNLYLSYVFAWHAHLSIQLKHAAHSGATAAVRSFFVWAGKASSIGWSLS